MSEGGNVVERILIACIRAYQRTAPYRPPACRFHPTCSEYAAQAIQRHGVGRGVWFALCRVARCHPFHPGGDDPVPALLKSSEP